MALKKNSFKSEIDLNLKTTKYKNSDPYCCSSNSQSWIHLLCLGSCQNGFRSLFEAAENSFVSPSSMSPDLWNNSLKFWCRSSRESAVIIKIPVANKRMTKNFKIAIPDLNLSGLAFFFLISFSDLGFLITFYPRV